MYRYEVHLNDGSKFMLDGYRLERTERGDFRFWDHLGDLREILPVEAVRRVTVRWARV